MESKEIEDLTSKMNKMDEILNKNIFNNPIKESNEKIRKDLLEFKEIFKKNLAELAKQVKGGNIDALNNLGICFEYGKGVEQNDDKAYSKFVNEIYGVCLE